MTLVSQVMSLHDNSFVQFAMSIWKDMTVQAHYENICSSLWWQIRTECLIRDNTEIIGHLKSRLQNNFDRHELKSGSIQRKKTNKSQSIMISRGVDRHVTELSEKKKKPVH